MDGKRELARYSFKLASDIEQELQGLHRKRRELEAEIKDLDDNLLAKQAIKRRFVNFQNLLKDTLICPKCWGNLGLQQPLAKDMYGVLRCTCCNFVAGMDEPQLP